MHWLTNYDCTPANNSKHSSNLAMPFFVFYYKYMTSEQQSFATISLQLLKTNFRNVQLTAHANFEVKATSEDISTNETRRA